MSRILKYSEFIEYLTRGSGRTNELIRECDLFLLDRDSFNDNLVVIFPNYKMLQEFSKLISNIHLRSTSSGKLTSVYNNNNILLFTIDSFDECSLRGLRVKDVIFEAPEMYFISDKFKDVFVCMNKYIIHGTDHE